MNERRVLVTTADQQPLERLCAEILATARRQRTESLERARTEAESLVQAAASGAAEGRMARQREAQREAAHRTAVIRARTAIEVERLRLARIEALLTELRDETGRRLAARAGFDYRSTLIALAREAMAGIGGHTFILRLSPADAASLGTELLAALRGASDGLAVDLRLEPDPEVRGGGLVVWDATGRLMWDNQLTARLVRMWPELSRQIAHSALSPLPTGPIGGAQ